MLWSVGDAIMQVGFDHICWGWSYYNAYFDFHTISDIICAFMVMLKLCTLSKFGSELDKNTSHEQLLICLSLAMRQT
jgi:hypothetical protein